MARAVLHHCARTRAAAPSELRAAAWAVVSLTLAPIFVLVLAVLLAAPATALAQPTPQCAPPNMLVLFDVSGSMNADGKYTSAQNALHLVTQSSEADTRYGLMFFPDPGPYPVHCNIGVDLAVPLALNNWDPIYRKTSPTLYPGTDPNPEYFGGPRGDFDTPMYQALDAAWQTPDFADPTRRHYVLLLTDGVQDCCHGGDYDNEIDCDPSVPYTDPAYAIPAEYAENRADLVALVGNMRAAGISTFVVGFGAGVDAVTLDALAQAGGTAIPGCIGGGDCYYQAADGGELLTALQEIAQIVGIEVCDGVDNDCNGTIDERADEGCETACGSGVEICVDGALLACNAPAPQPETCDGIDNNCDTAIDEGCDCVHATTQPCGNDVGACTRGTQTCEQGAWGSCVGGTQATAETCAGDGLDEDCDGLINEGCDCTDGDTEICGSDVGACATGTQSCVDGHWGACTGGLSAALTDTCGNQIDDDCDGETDEYCECTDGELRACGSSLGPCEPGYQTCNIGTWGDCIDARVGSAETCNLIDDDCDGAIDEAAACAAGDECRCGHCAGPCDMEASSIGTCAGPAVCIAGWCIVDHCPEGFVCDGTTCVEEGYGVWRPEDKIQARKTPPGVAKGCGCAHGTGNRSLPLLLAGLFAGAWSCRCGRRRRR